MICIRVNHDLYNKQELTMICIRVNHDLYNKQKLTMICTINKS